MTPLKDAGLIDDIEPVVRVVLERESLGSTGIGDGVAIPHGKLNNANEVMCVFARSQRGVDFDAIDGEPVHIFFLVLAPRGCGKRSSDGFVEDLADPSRPVIQEKTPESFG